MTDKKPKFEESLKKLEQASEKLISQDTSLDDAIKYYEEGIKYYRECTGILDEASQKIETLAKEDLRKK